MASSLTALLDRFEDEVDAGHVTGQLEDADHAQGSEPGWRRHAKQDEDKLGRKGQQVDRHQSPVVAQVEQVAAKPAILLGMTGREQAREKLHGERPSRMMKVRRFEQERVVEVVIGVGFQREHQQADQNDGHDQTVGAGQVAVLGLVGPQLLIGEWRAGACTSGVFRTVRAGTCVMAHGVGKCGVKRQDRGTRRRLHGTYAPPVPA